MAEQSESVNLSRPSGTCAHRPSSPSVETLGYYRKSLRDKDLRAFCECQWASGPVDQILVALDILVRFSVDRAGEADKNVRAPIAVGPPSEKYQMRTMRTMRTTLD